MTRLSADKNKNSLPALAPVTLPRRGILQALAGAALLPALPRLGLAQQAEVLPLNTPGLDHLDIIVPDVEASARFYMALFNTRLHAQPFQGGFRYFVLLGEMNERREVGYVAIGESRGRGTYIGHFCTSVADYRRDSQAIWEAMGQRFHAEGFGVFPGATGIGGIFADPDGIEIQFLPAPDTLVTAAAPSDLVAANSGLVTPLAVADVTLRVSDLERALDYYRILYGEPAAHIGDRARFDFANGSRLLLLQASYAYGAPIGIEHFGIRTAAFDPEAVRVRVEEAGGKVLEGTEAAPRLALLDPDGIRVDLVPVE